MKYILNISRDGMTVSVAFTETTKYIPSEYIAIVKRERNPKTIYHES